MRALLTIVLAASFLISCQSSPKPTPEPVVADTMTVISAFESKLIKPRQVEIRPPKGYDPNGSTRYPVLYMHDGQNVFNPETAYGGQTWGIQENVDKLVADGIIRDCFVVAVWNSEKRHAEYGPNKPFLMMDSTLQDSIKSEAHSQFDDKPISDEYLAFLVTELKPYIDQEYRTLSDRDNTYIMGSSMGGLISIYAVAEYPEVFGRAACVSTHWPFSVVRDRPNFREAMIAYLDERIPNLKEHHLYFDYGTETLDAWYEPHQLAVDSLFEAHGFPNDQYRSLKFEGAAHNEPSWRERVHLPLTFLLGKS